MRPRIAEASVLGAAMLAGLATGNFKTVEEAATVFVQTDRVFEPDTKRQAVYRETHALYQQLYLSLAPILENMQGLNPPKTA